MRLFGVALERDRPGVVYDALGAHAARASFWSAEDPTDFAHYLRTRDGRAVRREDGMDRPRYVREHLGAVVDAVAAGAPVTAYFHWSLMDNYEWGTYEPRYGLFGVDRSDPTTVRFMDTDAVGDDAAGEFTRVVRGLQAGDRSVLGGPG